MDYLEWREGWKNRSFITRFDKEEQALKYIKKHPTYENHPLKTDYHLKDLWVVYYEREE